MIRFVSGFILGLGLVTIPLVVGLPVMLLLSYAWRRR